MKNHQFAEMQLRRLETNNKALATRLPPIEGQQKEIQYPAWHKSTTGKGCEVEKMMRFLKETQIFEEI